VVRALEGLALPRVLGQRKASVTADVEERADFAVARAGDDDRRRRGPRGEERSGLGKLPEMPGVLPRSAEDPLLLAAQNLGVGVPGVGERLLDWVSLST